MEAGSRGSRSRGHLCIEGSFEGKNATGLFVSINGFTEPFLKRFEQATPFIALDGSDLFMVLDGRVRLDDLLRAKKRHANETGSCCAMPGSALASLCRSGCGLASARPACCGGLGRRWLICRR